MDTMQFAKYSCDIREILSKVDQEGLENLVRNAVAYAQSNNNGKATVTSYYVNQIYKNEQYNLYWFINSKEYAHVLKPCKVLLNG